MHLYRWALAAGIIRKQRPELDETGSLALAALADGCPGQALTIEADGLLALYGRILEALLAGHGKAPERIERALALAADLAEAKEGIGPLASPFADFSEKYHGGPNRNHSVRLHTGGGAGKRTLEFATAF